MASPLPKVIVHMISSIDGRLRLERYSKPLHPEVDYLKEYFQISSSYRIQAHCVCNASTIEIIGQTFESDKCTPAKELKTYFGKRETECLFVVFDSKGKVKYTSDKLIDCNILAVLGEGVSEEYLSFLREKGISYLFAGKDGRDYKLALEKLYSEFGVKAIALEGGGIINGAFLKFGFIDEISILMVPSIDGLSGSPSIFEYKGGKDEKPADGMSFELLECKQLTQSIGSVLLRYKVHKY